jgi:hypothetical protein
MFAASKTASVSGAYQISRSLRFNSADSAYLNRTPASATNRRTFTWSAWVKRGTLGSYTTMFSGVGGGSGPMDYISFDSNNKFLLSSFNGVDYIITTLGVFRDPSAWYHLVVAVDTTQATSTNRIKLYVNGVNQTDTSGSYPTQNYDTQINNNVIQYIGNNQYNYWNGYMTEVNFIDGQQLTPSSFGQTNAQTGVWEPIAFSGTYGTNGFYVNFSDNSNTTAATLGKDYSPNGNNWTPNNFSVTAGAGNDSLVDSPTSYGVDTGAGGTVRGNYCTANPLDMNSSLAIRNGNLDVVESGGNWLNGRCTFGMSSGKWYFESTVTSGSFQVVGIANSLTINTGYNGGVGNWAYSNDGAKIVNGVYTTPYGASFTTNDVIGIAFDADTGTLTMYKNGTSQGTLVSGLAANTYFPWVAVNGSTVSMNFGQRPFAYTAPSGFKALCTQNLPTPTIGATTATQANLYFNPAIYTGTNATQSITTEFQPDLVWIKSRSAVSRNTLFDAVRGVTKVLWSDSTDAEGTANAGTGLTSLNSTGFTLGTEIAGTSGSTNVSGVTYVAWNWRASNATAVTNTAGSITSTVSANTTSGFSVVTYTGTGANATVGHGLGVAPSMIICKGRSVGSNYWQTQHSALGPTKALFLNTTDAAFTNAGYWNNTAPTSTVFSLGGNTDANGNGTTYVAYCFSPIAGYSAFGSYTGNGSTDGVFVYTGFRPAFVMIKSTSFSEDWTILDATRNPYNVADEILKPNLSDATYIFSIEDFVSNGFKLRSTGSLTNSSGNTYIYMAFASHPFKTSLAR